MDLISCRLLKIDEKLSSFLSKTVEDVLQFHLDFKPCKITYTDLYKGYTKLSDTVDKSSVKESFDNKCLFNVLPLYNNGNNCYINSSMQSLLTTITDELLTALRQARHANTPAIELFNAYIDQLERRPNVWNVANNIRNLKYFSKNFRTGSQEDAQEFLNGFLDRLREEFDKIEKFKGPKNPVRRTYAPSFDSRYYCSKCHKSNIATPHVQEELTFFLDLADTLPTMLDSALTNRSNNYSCDFCKTNGGSAQMNAVFTSLPRSFICCVKRFKHNLFSGSKIHREIQFSKSLNLPYVDSNQKRRFACYDLSSIVIHSGSSIHSGHYECVSHVKGKWYRISDSYVREISESQASISSKNGSYIYIFTRSGTDNKRPEKRKATSGHVSGQNHHYNNHHQPSPFKKHKQWKGSQRAHNNAHRGLTNHVHNASASQSIISTRVLCQNS